MKRICFLLVVIVLVLGFTACQSRPSQGSYSGYPLPGKSQSVTSSQDSSFFTTISSSSTSEEAPENYGADSTSTSDETSESEISSDAADEEVGFEEERGDGSSDDCQGISTVVYGEDKPLPSYDELVDNIDKYMEEKFVLRGSITNVGYYIRADYAHYDIKYDETKGHVVEVHIPTAMYASDARGVFSATGTLKGTDGDEPVFLVDDIYTIERNGVEKTYDYDTLYEEKMLEDFAREKEWENGPNT